MNEPRPSLSIGEALSSATSNIFNIKGRARRSEYWWTTLVVFLLSIVLTPLAVIFDLLTIPLFIRRLHDGGHSGKWWLLSAALKMVIYFEVLYFFLTPFVDALFGGVEYDNQELTNFILENGVMLSIFVILTLIVNLVLFFFTLQDSDAAENKYGPSPKYSEPPAMTLPEQ